MQRLLLFVLVFLLSALLSALSKHAVFGVAQQGELAEQVGFDARFQQSELAEVVVFDARFQQGEDAEVVGFDAHFQQGELVVSNLEKSSVWISRQRRSRSVFGEMRTSVGSEYYLRHIRSSATGTRLRVGPHSWSGFAFFEDYSPAQADQLRVGPHSWSGFFEDYSPAQAELPSLANVGGGGPKWKQQVERLPTFSQLKERKWVKEINALLESKEYLRHIRSFASANRSAHGGSHDGSHAPANSFSDSRAAAANRSDHGGSHDGSHGPANPFSGSETEEFHSDLKLHGLSLEVAKQLFDSDLKLHGLSLEVAKLEAQASEPNLEPKAASLIDEQVTVLLEKIDGVDTCDNHLRAVSLFIFFTRPCCQA